MSKFDNTVAVTEYGFSYECDFICLRYSENYFRLQVVCLLFKWLLPESYVYGTVHHLYSWVKRKPTWCHLFYYLFNTHSMLNMFRRRLLKMVVLTAETCWALNEYWINNKISGIKLVFSLLNSYLIYDRTHSWTSTVPLFLVPLAPRSLKPVTNSGLGQPCQSRCLVVGWSPSP